MNDTCIQQFVSDRWLSTRFMSDNWQWMEWYIILHNGNYPKQAIICFEWLSPLMRLCFIRVCHEYLSVCLLVCWQDYAKCYGRISAIFHGRINLGPRWNPQHFGGDLDLITSYLIFCFILSLSSMVTQKIWMNFSEILSTD